MAAAAAAAVVLAKMGGGGFGGNQGTYFGSFSPIPSEHLQRATTRRGNGCTQWCIFLSARLRESRLMAASDHRRESHATFQRDIYSSEYKTELKLKIQLVLPDK